MTQLHQILNPHSFWPFESNLNNVPQPGVDWFQHAGDDTNADFQPTGLVNAPLALQWITGEAAFRVSNPADLITMQTPQSVGSVSCIFKTAQATAGTQILVCSHGSIASPGANNSQWLFVLPTNTRNLVRGDLLFNTETVYERLTGSGTTDVNDGNWHHVAMTYDNRASGTGLQELWVDGVLDGSRTIAASRDLPIEQNPVGAHAHAMRHTGHGGSVQLEGGLMMVARFTTVLTPAEIQSISNAVL